MGIRIIQIDKEMTQEGKVYIASINMRGEWVTPINDK
jgi:hypothetical protein